MPQQLNIFEKDHNVRIKHETYLKLCKLKKEIYLKSGTFRQPSIADTIEYLLENINGNK